VFSNCSYESTAKWEICPIFQRGQTVGVRLAVETVIKSATLLGVFRAAVPKFRTSYTDHGKTSSVKRNND
jgi:hypothetical protein